ncbi:MAG: T9SS type A sorting domain-containing protein [candidate division KSB1 bacterium]|nr:T9SS type A sorting domain-containing protein [candidate division KSB1 bacterium]MDZ7345323.1 T9SS type A sorting domain-containing protein [candidate division KSB1 bacterium]
MKRVMMIVAAACAVLFSQELPPPVSYYDFEEPDGVVVIDQGSAANHGEIVDNSGLLVRTTGGIFSKPADGRGCIEFAEFNAFGELCYVRIPYKPFLNSPNYTLSAWIQYSGTPNWGYIFWMGGDVWPEDPMERHIDVWLNPGINGIDCILNAVDGSQPRAQTKEAECGIGVMDGEWHLVTVTLADNLYYKIYLDGILCTEIESPAEIVTNSGDDLYLGARPNDAEGRTAVKIVGLMDRVRIWDIALDEKQVELLFKMEGPNGGTVGVKEKNSSPQVFVVYGNYPNPFNPETVLRYALDQHSMVSLDIFDALGKPVRNLFRGVQTPGEYTVLWDGRDNSGRKAAAGVYFYILKAGERSAVGKMTLLQ